jgi:2-dehydropantoate 2-reductase
MRVHILGAGSLGSAIGGTLAAAGTDVTLISRSHAHVEAIDNAGLRMRTDDGERVVKVHAAINCEGLEPADLLIVLVKSFDTLSAITAAQSIVGENTTVLSMQNGLGHETLLAEVCGAERVIAGKSYVGGDMVRPGYVIAGTRGKRTIIGELDGTITPRITAIRDEFERAGLTTIVSENIVGVMWDKLLVNVSTGALSAITGLAYGELYRVPEIEACAVAAVSEAMAVAAAEGVSLSIDAPRDAWLMAGTGLPADFRTSMLQSLDKGSITEIDYINGAVVRIGQRHSVATPVNAALVAAVKGIEHRMVVSQKDGPQ